MKYPEEKIGINSFSASLFFSLFAPKCLDIEN